MWRGWQVANALVGAVCVCTLVLGGVGGGGVVTAQGEAQPVFSMVSVSSSRATPGGSVIITARIVDTLADVQDPPSVAYLLPDGNDGPFAAFVRISGTPRDGIYRAIVTVSQFYPPGQYVVKELRAFDRSGNVTVLTPPNPAASSLTLIVTPNVGEPPPAPTATTAPAPGAAVPPLPTPTPRPAPPVVPMAVAAPPPAPLATVAVAVAAGTSVPIRNPENFQPALVSLEIADPIAVPGGMLTVTARITDAAGDVLDFPSIRYRLPDGTDGPFAYLRRVSGNARDGVYEATIGLSPFYPTGIYTIKELRVADTARNSVVYSAPAPMQPDAPFVVRPFVPVAG